jgi:hypothetical protein
MGVVSFTPRPLYPLKETRYSLYMRLGGPQGRSGQIRKISPQPGSDLRTVQPVASRSTFYAIPAHIQNKYTPVVFSYLLLRAAVSVHPMNVSKTVLHILSIHVQNWLKSPEYPVPVLQTVRIYPVHLVLKSNCVMYSFHPSFELKSVLHIQPTPYPYSLLCVTQPITLFPSKCPIYLSIFFSFLSFL